MKNILILLVLLLAADLASGQKPGAVYIITTSISIPNQTGVEKIISNKTGSSLHKTNPLHYFMRKQDNSVEVRFGHYDYNLTELAKKRKVMTSDRMEIITKPKSFLNSIQPIDIDIMIKTKSNAELWKWANNLKWSNTPIYLIDRNDFTSDSIKLIEVGTSNNAPDNPLRQ